jgi:hypothetical protein
MMKRVGIEIGILVVLIRLERLNLALREVQGAELKEAEETARRKELPLPGRE